MNPSNQDRTMMLQENYTAFKELLPTLGAKKGQWVLMYHKRCVEIFDSAGDAHKYARGMLPDDNYSVQEVTLRPVDLGWHSHVVSAV